MGLTENLEVLQQGPSEEFLRKLTKTELLEVGKHFDLPVKSAMRKAEVTRLVVEHLVDENVLPEQFLDSFPEVLTEIRKLELQIKMEQERLKADRERWSVEIKMKELELQDNKQKADPIRFEASKVIRLVPPFQEKDVDKYFQQFEKVARNLKWPVEHWTILLQSVLRGKAQDVFSSLSIHDSADYQKVKAMILKSYELVPEAYRQRFRNFRKLDKDTFVEFSREKEIFFDRWCNSVEVKSDYESLKQLILIEEFKNCVPSVLRTYLDEHKVKNVRDTAVLADEYTLAHKSDFGNVYSNSVSFDSARPKSQNGAYSNVSTYTRPDGVAKNSRFVAPRFSCAYCKKQGHVISECFKLKQKTSGSSPTGIVTTDPLKSYHPFVTDGFVSMAGTGLHPIKILRDTGASQSLLLGGVLPLSDKSSVGANVLIKGVECTSTSIPLHNINLQSDLVTGSVVVGVMPCLPVGGGISLLLGNDLAGSKVLPNPRVIEKPQSVDSTEQLIEEFPNIFPACAVTRSKKSRQPVDIDLSDTFMSHNVTQLGSNPNSLPNLSLDRGKFIEAQGEDSELKALTGKILGDDEILTVPVGFFMKSGILMRKWRAPEVPADNEWSVTYQIVIPYCYREHILQLAHDHKLSSHLGVTKTLDRVRGHFYWPKMRRDVVQYCKTCHTCQLTGKPNQTIPRAPLEPIPAFEEPFQRVIVDCVGPLPKTRSGNQYLLTIMCASTRFPEAIPLRNITARSVLKALIKFFTLMGLPASIQSDQGSNFVSNVFQQVMLTLGVQQVTSSAYHPQSQGALERFHQTLKSMMRTYCLNNDKDWDEGVPLMLFAVREVVQESLGFSPFELVFGHNVRGPLKLLKEKWLGGDETSVNILDYVTNFKTRLHHALNMARSNLKHAQEGMKAHYDKTVKPRVFNVGDNVLVLLPVMGSPLRAKYHGPYVIEKVVNDLNYIVITPDRRKSRQLCHVNLIKRYYVRGTNDQVTQSCGVKEVASLASTDVEDDATCFPGGEGEGPQIRLRNSEILAKLDAKLDHLSPDQRGELKAIIRKFDNLFPDAPSRCKGIEHDVDVEGAMPIKQHAYRANPLKLEQMRKELNYMLENDIIEPCNSNWSSPCLLVPKPDGTFRFCTDFRKVNSVTKTDCFPIPRVDDCIDRVGTATYITKFDLLKGYWQVPLSERAKDVCAFVTPDGLFRYKVMPFGVKNAPATFQRMMNDIVSEVPGCWAYIDDVIIESCDWNVHIARILAFFRKCSEIGVTINLSKSDFCKAKVVYLGHEIGNGEVKPIKAKVAAIENMSTPTNKRGVMRFLGMAGFYRKFCPNFSEVASPLTDLLKKNTKFVWSPKCQSSFEKISTILTNSPVLLAPNFNKRFKLAVDASDLGIGAVLMQEQGGIDHPVCYYSKKFNETQRRYATVEKEAFALLMALNHFDVYLCPTSYSVEVFTDHNPLVFIHKMKNKNQRLLRWSLTLQRYNLDVKHIKGVENVIADTLSRC